MIGPLAAERVEVVMNRNWTDGQREAHDELSKYDEYQKDMQFYAMRVERLETDYMRINQRLDGDMVKSWNEELGGYMPVYQGAIQRTRTPNRATTKIASFLDQKTEFEQRYEESERACVQLEQEIRARLDGYPDHNRCLGYYYLFRLPLSEVAEVMNYSLSKVKDLRKEGLAIYYEAGLRRKEANEASFNRL